MRIEASAPGKLVLTGEYAVLEGTPALSFAVPRRARVVLSDAAGEDWRIDARGGERVQARCRPGVDGLQWLCPEDTRARLSLVDAVLRWRIIGAPQCYRGGLDMSLDTREFFDQRCEPARKLGMGSSAALTVAFAAALADYSRGPAAGRESEPAGTEDAEAGLLLPRLLRMHREFQGGHGSGVDIATSLYGGLISFRRTGAGDEGADVTRQRLPQGLGLAGVWTGHAASTRDYLRGLRAWRGRDEAGYRELMALLHARGIDAERKAREMDADGLVQAVHAYAEGLAELGGASGLDIVSAAHRRIGALAASHGVVYKPSGAGGGDLGIAISRDREALGRLRDTLREAGFTPLQVSVDPAGLELSRSLE